MLFSRYKSKIDYYKIASEISKMSREMATSLTQSFIVSDDEIKSSITSSIEIFTNNFYAYGITLVRGVILYKLSLPESEKEVEAMIDAFAKLKGMTAKFIKGMILDDSSVIFKGKIVKELLDQLTPVLGPYATSDLFEGYFTAIDIAVDEWGHSLKGGR